jgi:hypothetical protein
MKGELRRGGGWSVGSGGRDCARGNVAGRWRADVWNIFASGSGGGGFGYGGKSEEWRRDERACLSIGHIILVPTWISFSTDRTQKSIIACGRSSFPDRPHAILRQKAETDQKVEVRSRISRHPSDQACGRSTMRSENRPVRTVYSEREFSMPDLERDIA